MADHTLFVIASDDAFLFGVLSSRFHSTFALAAGSRMGVGNDLRWRNVTCFEPFPFAHFREQERQHIQELGEQVDAHRKRQQTLHPDLTITGMYNVLEKLRTGEELTAKEKKIHEQGLVSVLKQIHDDLDAAMFDAYGWPHDLTDEQILERLIALNAERADEENRGLIRWLRPEFQNPTSGTRAVQATIDVAQPIAEALAVAELKIWPKDLPQQIAAIRDLVRTNGEVWSVELASRQFKGARKKDIESVLDSLASPARSDRQLRRMCDRPKSSL